MKSRLFILTCLLITTYGFANGQANKEKTDFLIEFYKSYLIACDNFKTSHEQLKLLKSKNCTERLLSYLDNNQLDYDPFLDAQDCDMKWLESLNVKPLNKTDNVFVMSYNTGWQDKVVKLKLTILKSDGHYKIDGLERLNEE